MINIISYLGLLISVSYIKARIIYKTFHLSAIIQLAINDELYPKKMNFEKNHHSDFKISRSC